MHTTRKMLLAIVIALICLPALAYDCSDYLRWNLQDRIKQIERRLGYYKFNPSYYTNVPSSWLAVQYDIEKICLKDENKSKNLDDAYDAASIKSGMKRL